MPTLWIEQVIDTLANQAPEKTFFSFPFNIYGMAAIILVGLVCGGVGALVVGNRMAFFSDALAHCAFAGVALGLVFGLVTGADENWFRHWLTLIMVLFGIVIGLGIAFVREKTAQASDTVIGVFFAGAIGFGAILLKVSSFRRYLPPEDFLFGNLVTVGPSDLLVLLLLCLCTYGVLFFGYNALVFSSFNTSLARSRGIWERYWNYLFIVLLAVIVNICLKIVGVLLINALLIVPAATAANLSKNMRQLFYYSIILCLVIGLGGQWLSWEIALPGPEPNSRPIHLPASGTIVVLGVTCYFTSMIIISLGKIALGSSVYNKATSTAQS